MEGSGFLAVFGKTGRNQGEFSEPNGIAVDSKDNLYVADVTNHRVQKLSRDGRFLAEWKGPAPAFYGPRDVWVSSDDFVYVGRRCAPGYNPACIGARVRASKSAGFSELAGEDDNTNASARGAGQCPFGSNGQV